MNALSKYAKWMMIGALASTLLSACGTDDEEPYVRPVGSGPWVLVDLYHTTKQNPVDYIMDRNTYGYQGVFAFWRAFDHLTTNGMNWTAFRTVPLSAERLEGFDALFINLVSSDNPDFTAEEITAIQEFVFKGGGLFVIADHTNVYRHAERMNPILKPMGVQIHYSIATDTPPVHSVAGIAWIMVRDFVAHPVTEDLIMISLQTGGPMQTPNAEGGVAFTSNEAFADFWDETDPGGFYGNWTFDGDETVEPKGPLEVVTATTYGQGRVVVAGDQNMFGDAYLHFGSNFELFMNSMDWVTKKEGKRLREYKPRGTNIGFYQPASEYRAGKGGTDGSFSYYVNGNRDLDVTLKGSVDMDGLDDAMMLMNPTVALSTAELDDLSKYLKPGKRLVVTFESDRMNQVTVDILKKVAPDFNVNGVGLSESSKLTSTVATERVEIATLEGRGILESSKMELLGTTIATLKSQADPVETLLGTTSTWGEPLLQAKIGNKTIDIARVKSVNGGELIIFLQDEFFRSSTMGEYLSAPNEKNKDAHNLQFSLQNYLKTPIAE
jgi:hypothetical protein